MPHKRRSQWLPYLASMIFVASPCLSSAPVAIGLPSIHHDQESLAAPSLETIWLGDDGLPLPFESNEEVLDFLRNARVMDTKVLSSGITRPLKVTLERDGIRAAAIFRSVDRELGAAAGGPLDRHRERDSFRFELAAYELDRLLGLGRVPPVVPREIDGRPGSLQLWLESTRTEHDYLETPLRFYQPARRVCQRQLMAVFDLLIYNTDRHAGNILLDDGGRMWFIDHTRAFKRLPVLASTDRLAVAERSFLEQLQRLREPEIREALTPYLDALELGSLLSRRRQLLRYFDRLIEERGEQAVVFDIDRPQTSTAGQPEPIRYRDISLFPWTNRVTIQ